MTWPKNIYVATTNLGIYYTENFAGPETQPTWYPVNTGLPSTDVREFAVHPQNPRIQYCLLDGSRNMYRRVDNGIWEWFADGASIGQGTNVGIIHGFEVTSTGTIRCSCGPPGVIEEPHAFYIVSSTDGGIIWVSRDITDAGGDPCSRLEVGIFTYGLGSPRYNAVNFSGHIGGLAHNSMTWFRDAEPPPCDSYEEHIQIGAGSWSPALAKHPLGNRFYTCELTAIGGTHFGYLGDTSFVAISEDLFMGTFFHNWTNYDAMWFDPNDVDHHRMLSNGSMVETFNDWTSWDVGSYISDKLINIASWYGDDLDQMILGAVPYYHYERDHVIKCIDGVDDTNPIGIAGAMALDSPYTGSIPYTCGIIARNGIYAFDAGFGIRTYAVAMPGYLGDSRGTPMAGDRSAWDETSYPEHHARDLKDAMPRHHTPTPSGVNCFVYSPDGERWQTINIDLASLASLVRETILTFSGEITVSDNPYRIYQLFGNVQSISRVFLSVASAPLGDDIIVDVRINGESIFTEINKPRILDGSMIGESTIINESHWPIDSYITAHVEQIGSSYSGSYLVVHIIHGYDVFQNVSSRHAFLEGTDRSSVSAFLQGPTGSTVHAYLRGPDPETDDRQAYLKGSDNALGDKDVYLFGVAIVDSSVSSYLQGGY